MSFLDIKIAYILYVVLPQIQIMIKDISLQNLWLSPTRPDDYADKTYSLIQQKNLYKEVNTSNQKCFSIRTFHIFVKISFDMNQCIKVN